MQNLRIVDRSRDELVLVDPANPRGSLRFNKKLASKTAGPNIALDNVRWSMTDTAPSPITIGDNTGSEIISIKLVVSGSVQNQAAVLAAMERAFIRARLAAADLVTNFLPDSVVFPTVVITTEE